jgi:group I intron endonuclease
MKGYIYKIINPSGKIYIGQTTDLKRRHKEYERLYINKSQSKIYNSIKKYGWDKHILEVLEECLLENINLREEYYINLYNSVDEGLNICHSGQAIARGRVKDTEWRKKIGESHKGLKHSDETKKLMSISNTGKNKGRKITWENKISKSKKGKPQSESHKNNRANSKKRSVLRTNITNKEIIKFDSVIEAANSIGLKRGTIVSECCKSKRQNYKNYEFTYA